MSSFYFTGRRRCPQCFFLFAQVGDDGPAESRSRGRESDLSSGVYQPPKLAAVPFEDDDSKEARKLRRNAKEQLKMANTEIMRDLRSEYTDTPEEISHNDLGNAGADPVFSLRCVCL